MKHFVTIGYVLAIAIVGVGFSVYKAEAREYTSDRQERRVVRMEERLQAEEARLARQVERMQARFCDRVERMNARYDMAYTLPVYCGEEPIDEPAPVPDPQPEPEPEPEPQPELVSDVIVNEIAWMGTETSPNDEWIELYNRGTAAQDLTGWTLVAEDGTPSLELTGTLGAGEYLLLERQDDNSVPGTTADIVYPFGDSLGNSGEVLLLKDNTSATVDTVAGGTDWALGGNNSTKETLQRASDDTWFTAPGTPKAENSAA